MSQLITDLVRQDTPVALVRSLGIYNLRFNSKECFPILVLDGSMGELHKYIGAGATLNDALDIAVDYVEFLKFATPDGWTPKTTVISS